MYLNRHFYLKKHGLNHEVLTPNPLYKYTLNA